MPKNIRQRGDNNRHWSYLSESRIWSAASKPVRVFRVSRFYFNGHPYLSASSGALPRFDFPSGFTTWTRGVRKGA